MPPQTPNINLSGGQFSRVFIVYLVRKVLWKMPESRAPFYVPLFKINRVTHRHYFKKSNKLSPLLLNNCR